MLLSDLVGGIEGFLNWPFADKIKLFAWYLHTYQDRQFFKSADIKGCFDELHISGPSSISPFLTAMVNRSPKEVLQNGKGFCLEARIRQEFDGRFGQREATVKIHKILSDLPGRISIDSEKKYLEESLICFKHKAFRASVVMCWNLAFDHLCEYVLGKHLITFNAQLPRSYPKASISVINKRDDFSELKESEVLQVCKSANIISGSVHKILKEKLDRRNIAAHPSGVVTSEPTAEEFIKDLVENVLLKVV